MTPGMPPSRTSRLEPTPITVTGTSARQCREKGGEVFAIGGAEQHFRRAADAEPGHAARSARSRSSRPRTGGSAGDQAAPRSGRARHHRGVGSVVPSAASSPGSALAH